MIPALSYCNCCGLPIVHAQVEEYCPQCHYPITVEKEEQFLEASLRDLQRVAHYGGTNLTVGGLISRYQMRLHFLFQLKQNAATAKTSTPMFTVPPPNAAHMTMPVQKQFVPREILPHSLRSGLKAPFAQNDRGLTDRFFAAAQNDTAAAAQNDRGLTDRFFAAAQNDTAQSAQNDRGAAAQNDRAQSMPAGSMVGTSLPLQRQTEKKQRSFIFSWRPFVVDQAITIIGLLGAFLILMGALSAIVTTSNRLVSFLIVFGTHAFFGIAGVVTYRFASFRLISRIYVGIYAFLVPLVGFTVYSLIQGNYIQLSLPMLIAIASGYAAIAYFLLAIYQRFPVFGYLGGMALIVTDIAIAQNLNLAYWWWPSMLMVLAFPAMYTIAGRGQVFGGKLAVLRQPVRNCMYGIVGICVFSIIIATLSLVPTFGNSYALSGPPPQEKELRFAILTMTAMLLLWTTLFFGLTKRTQGLLVLAYELLACVLAICYAFNATPSIYVLVLTATALLYHGVNRFLLPIGKLFEQLGKNLDRFALALVGIVPLIGSATVPLRLYTLAFHTTALIPFVLRSQIDFNVPVELIALTLGCVLTLSIVLHHVQHSAEKGEQEWTWALLLGGFLLTWEYSLVVVVWQLIPVWSFLALTLVLIATAVVVRQRFGATRSNPLEAVVVGAALLTFVLSLGVDAVERSSLFFFIAACSYGILLFQRRSNALFVPLLLALAALPDVMSLPYLEMFLISVGLPLVAIGVHRLMPAPLRVMTDPSAERVHHTIVWEWPLLCFGLLCGAIVSAHDALLSTSAVTDIFHVAFPAALEMAMLAGVWYIGSALTRVRWWLVVAIAFATGAVLLPSNPFWVMVALTPITAFLAVMLSRRAGKGWASPLYIVALLAAGMSGVTAYDAHLYAAIWILPAFGLLAYAIGIVEGMELCLWLLPLFVTWSVIDAAMLGDLYNPPIVALAFTVAGVMISLGTHIPMFAAIGRDRLLRCALPFYSTALAAALLTGIYGTLKGANSPFYGAIPDALLLYAVVAFAVALYERRHGWLWSVALFAVWGTYLSVDASINYTVAIALLAGVVGMGVGRVIPHQDRHKAPTATATQPPVPTHAEGRFFAAAQNDRVAVQNDRGQTDRFFAAAQNDTGDAAQNDTGDAAQNDTGDAAQNDKVAVQNGRWSWPWYLTSLVAMGMTVVWQSEFGLPQPINFLVYSLLAFATLTIAIMLVERTPEAVVLAAGLTAFAIHLWQPSLAFPVSMSLYTILCVFIFAAQSVWKVLPPGTRWLPEALLHRLLGLGGQLLVVVIIIANGGLNANAGLLAFVGAGSLLVLALLLLWDRHFQRNSARPSTFFVQRYCVYAAGLLASLVVSWVLIAFQQTNIDLLLLPPATYLILVASLLMRDEALPNSHTSGQVVAILGAACLLLPSLWLSFANSDANLLYAIVLLGEALLLLLLGFGVGMRIFILTSAGLIVVGALRTMFLTSLGIQIPTYLILTMLGVVALALATVLSLFGRRLRTMWQQWD